MLRSDASLFVQQHLCYKDGIDSCWDLFSPTQEFVVSFCRVLRKTVYL